MGEQNYRVNYERDLVVNNRELKYKGIFLFDELVATIDSSLENRGYEKQEKRTEETVTESGRKTYLELRPFKVKSNYARYMIKMKINLDNVTESLEEVQGLKKKFQKGEINIIFDSWLLTDYYQRWNMKPWVYFWKGLINKYVYKFPFEASFKGELAGDTVYIYTQIKKLLNSYKFETGKIIKEENIKREVAKEIKSSLKEEKGDDHGRNKK